MNPNALAFIGLTALMAALVAVLMFAITRVFAAARGGQRRPAASVADTAILSSALEEAVARLRDQERATAARAEASERLSNQIIDSITSGLLVVGLDGGVRIMNPAARRLLNREDESSSGDYRQVIGEPALSQTIDECLSTGTAVVRRTVHLPEERVGASRFGVPVSPLFDANHQLSGAVCLFSDLTAVQQLEEQLRLKESLATVGELTAGIAHEFRNGLATIHGYGKLIDPQVLPEAYRPYIEGIRAEAVSLGEIVTNFLSFARPAQLALTAFDLKGLCERIADEVRADAGPAGGEVVLRGEFPTLRGDEVLIRQVFRNLLRNAVEACADASIIPRIVVESSVDHARSTCTISVDDNGPGIAPQARERLFQPFFTTRRAGTGLGLAIVQKIVVSHNGRVTAGAAPDGGARLQVVLPLS